MENCELAQRNERPAESPICGRPRAHRRWTSTADMGQGSAASSRRGGLAHRRAPPVRGEEILSCQLPAEMDLRSLAATIKARWICEQAHQQLKEELGLDHFEGRSWHGLHRHAL